MKIFFALLIILLLVIIEGMWEVRHFKITRYTIKTDKEIGDLDGKNLVLISDLHLCEYGRNNEQVFAALSKINPDKIFIAGDLVIGNRKYDTVIAKDFVNELSKKYDVYFANGNHEQRMRENRNVYGNKYRTFIKGINKNIKVLNNRSTDINEYVRVTGFTAHNSYFVKFRVMPMELKYINKKIKKCDRRKYNILIAHSPEYFDIYKDWGADLVLSGHNHGGIVRLPFLGGIISPQYKIFDKYDKGVFRKEKSTMILSSGLGSHTINYRFNNRPEIVIFTINKNK